MEFIHELDKHNFFYNSITTLAYAQFGINELYARGFFSIKNSQYLNDRAGFINDIKTYQFPQDVENDILRTRTFTPRIFVPGFFTKDKSRSYSFNPNASALELIKDTGGITRQNIELTQMTIIAAWEKIQGYGLNDSLVYQFFRYIRNAAAHNGKFHFDTRALDRITGELIKPAEWKSFEIKSSLQGLPLIVENKNDNVGFFDQGDLVEFLLDFQNHYPQLCQ